MAMREARSFCSICAGTCGVRVRIGDDERIIDVRPDREHPLSQGYFCFKGAQLAEAHNGAGRLLHPLKRTQDGSFVRIGLEQALDEIATRLSAIIGAHGAEAIAGFRGTMSYTIATANRMLPDWLRAIGSPSFYSTMTVDQSAKWITFERLGGWGAGRQHYRDAEVLLFVGTNPLVSLSAFNFANQNPLLHIKAARERGTRIIVIDPRRSETARHADLFLQPYPGEDPTLIAGLLRIILSEGWHDAEFCARHVHGLERLRAAVDPFEPDYVAQRSGVPSELLRAAAAMFARDSRRGAAASGTGPNMAPHSNLAEHLIECLNVVCGRYARAGDPVPNPGVIGPRRPRRAEVIPPRRSWESGFRGRVHGLGTVFGERMSATLADEILLPGKGQIRALLVDGGNPANALPDQRKAVRALRALDLLVCIDPYLTNTARLAHYILPPKVFFERPNMSTRDYESVVIPAPFAQYGAALVPPPAGSEVVDDWYVFWALAKRLGKTIAFDGVPLDMRNTPTSDNLLAILTRHSAVGFEEIRKHSGGKIFDVPPMFVEPADRTTSARFEVMPDDVSAELAVVLREPVASKPIVIGGRESTHRLVVGRLRDVSNTMHHDLPAVHKRWPYNPARFHPDDMAQHGLAAGERIVLVGAHGRIAAIVEADDGLRPGVVTMPHGWGPLPDDTADYEDCGACTSLLVSTDCEIETINGMPRMTAIPVRIERQAATAVANAASK